MRRFLPVLFPIIVFLETVTDPIFRPKNSPNTLAKYKDAATHATTVVPGSSSGGETDPDGPSGPKLPVGPGNTGNSTTNSTSPPGNNSTATDSTSRPTSTNNDSGASSFIASAASVVLGAVAVAVFLI